MNKRNFDFHLEYKGASVQVRPYYEKLEKKTAKETGQEFYRESLQGQIRFVGKDFQIIYGEPIDTLFTLVIWEDTGSDKKQWYKGSFTKVNCKFDLAKEIAEPEFKTVDNYEKVLARYKEEFDLAKLVIPTEPIECNKKPFVQVYCAGASAVTNIYNGNSWESDTSAAIDDAAEIKSFGFGEIESFREIHVEGAKLKEVNGIYTEHVEYEESYPGSSRLIHRWFKKEKGQNTHCIQMVTGSGRSASILRLSDPAVLFSAEALSLPSDMFKQKGSLLGLVFTRHDDNGEPDFATVSKDFLYTIYARIVHGNSAKGVRIKTNDFAISNVSYKYCGAPDFIRFSISSDSSTAKTPYGTNDKGEYFTDAWLSSLPPTDRYLPICRSSWANASLWVAYENSVFKPIGTGYSVKYTLKDSFSIGNVIKALLAEIDISLSHSPQPEYSAFLYGPDFLLPDALELPTRYYVYITQKTNMIKGVYDQAAQTAKITLESVMGMLRDCFRCYWYIDASGNFKIEHVSYFMAGRSYSTTRPEPVNLVAKYDLFNKLSVLYRQEELQYDVSELSRLYKFSYVDESFLPFTGVQLSAEGSYIEGDKTEDISVGEFSADVDYMQIMSDKVTQDGFALLCPLLLNDKLSLTSVDMILVENGKAYTVPVQNGYASWKNLSGFYAYDMPSYNVIDKEGQPFFVRGVKHCLTQSARVPFITDLTPYDSVVTSVGVGRIVGILEDLTSGYLTLNLVYPLG